MELSALHKAQSDPRERESGAMGMANLSQLSSTSTISRTRNSRCWDEEYPKKRQLLRRSASDRRLPPSKRSSSLWSSESKDSVLEMRFGMMIARMSSKNKAAGGEAQKEELKRKEERHSPAASSCDDGSSIFSCGAHSSSFSSSVGSGVGNAAAAVAAAEEQRPPTPPTPCQAEAEPRRGEAFLDFDLVGGDLVATGEAKESSPAVLEEEGGEEDEEEERLRHRSALSSDSDFSDDEEFASARATGDVGSNIHANIRGIHWHLLRSYREIARGERRRVAHKLLRGCSPVSPARFFAHARISSPQAARSYGADAKHNTSSLQLKLAKATTKAHDIHCRPSAWSHNHQQRLPSIFRRRDKDPPSSSSASLGGAAAVANSSTGIRQGQLHCAPLNSFTFVVDGSDELLAARVLGGGGGLCFCFYAAKHRKQSSRQRPWRWQSSSSNHSGGGNKQEWELVARMRLKYGDSGVTEFVLVDNGRVDDHPSPPRPSAGFTSWDSACKSWCQPSPGRATRTNSSPRRRDRGGDDIQLLRELWEKMERREEEERHGEEIAAFVLGQKQIVAILPAGRHGISSDAAVPCPLLRRWRSGGGCDCGGWDLGCALNILHLQQECKGELNIALQGPGKQRDVLSLATLKDGLVSVNFKEAIVSPLQAFAAAVATLHGSGDRRQAGADGSARPRRQHRICASTTDYLERL